MEKQNITHYSNEELSLLVMNDEVLYRELIRSVRSGDFNIILTLVDELYIFTEEQEEDLRETWANEVEEYYQ